MLQNKNIHPIIWALLSGMLFWLSWPTKETTTILVFFAFVPLLWLEESQGRKNKNVWGYVLLAFLIWNSLTTWWIWYASEGGAVFAIIANSLLMTIPFMLYVRTKRIYGKRLGYWSLPVYWLGFEYLHLNWDISWPWLTLGNVFAMKGWWVQWYEYTGVLGGSFWVLLANIIIFNVFRYPSKRISLSAIRILIPIIIPMTISVWVLSTVVEDGEEIKVAAIQPCIDPYGEKFNLPVQDQVDQLMDLSTKAIDHGGVDLLLWPETAIQRTGGANNEGLIQQNSYFSQLKAFCQKNQVSVLSGIESWDFATSASDPDFVKHSSGADYQVFNAGLWLSVQDSMPLFYHKSRFVPGVEILPFPKVLGFILKIIDFDQSGSYAPQDTRPVFEVDAKRAIAPVICYESIYGDFLKSYVLNGADFITIITNDGWWKDTEGHRQHNAYARLRAIEMRRPVVRSANTGISSIIDIRGNEQKHLGWWKKGSVVDVMKSSSKITFYTEYGDFIGRISAFLAIVFALSTYVRKKTEVI